MIKEYDKDTLKKLQQTELQIYLDIKEVCEKNNIGCSIAYGSLIGCIRHKGFIPWDDDMDVIMFRDDYEKFEKIFDSQLGEKYLLMTPIRNKKYTGNVIKVMKKGTKFINKHNKNQKCEKGIFIDIFVYDKVPKDEKKYNTQKRKARILAMLIFLCGCGKPEINNKGVIGILYKVVCCVIHCLLKLIPGNARRLYKKYTKVCCMSNDEDTEVYTLYQDAFPDKYICKRSDFEPYSYAEFDGEMVGIPRNYHQILMNNYGDYMKLPPEEDRYNHITERLDFGPYK